jgi:hypothetical protein
MARPRIGVFQFDYVVKSFVMTKSEFHGGVMLMHTQMH